jgi:adenine-specific DNA-methyltransferase
MDNLNSITQKELNIQKLRGGYYTPKVIAEFLCRWAITKDTQRALEPSCGDGNFVEAAIHRFKEVGVDGKDLEGRIKGIELIQEESLKARKRIKKLGVNSATIVNSEFFKYIKTNSTIRYDVVLGNPPFIRYQNFPEEHRTLAFSMMNEMGLSPNKLTNIWLPFLVLSASLLNSNGKLGMVIPAGLFQVKYAAETRVFLSNFFNRITIITFKKLVFKGVQQEVVLLLCEKQVAQNKSRGIRTIECENLEELDSIDFAKINGSDVKPIDHSTEKWTKYFLSVEEINLLKQFKNDVRVQPCSNILEVDFGLVTGRNDFFMMKDEDVKKWELGSYTIPVVSKSNQLKGLSFSDKDFKMNSQAQQSVHLFIPPKKSFSKLPKSCQEYITFGESQDFHSGYTCRIRKHWYITPSLWSPDGYALRQIGAYPKLVLNKTEASSTDTVHRVRFKAGVDKKLTVLSFLNSLSFAFSEVTGRSYGGGVMTFVPTEIGEIRIPILKNIAVDFEEIDQLLQQREIEKVLDIVDEELLIKQHGFLKTEVVALRNIWKKLSGRRMNRK